RQRHHQAQRQARQSAHCDGSCPCGHGGHGFLLQLGAHSSHYLHAHSHKAGVVPHTCALHRSTLPRTEAGGDGGDEELHTCAPHRSTLPRTQAGGGDGGLTSCFSTRTLSLSLSLSLSISLSL
ncbi:hypothetical protein GOP47_0016147, partial [Adiantum capillus-veneris]